MKYRGFEPEQSGDLMFGIEHMSDIPDEIHPLHEAHYAETEDAYLSDPYDPDLARVYALEKDGAYIVFTARKNMELVGYVQYHMFRDLHTQQVYTAREDCFYITPKARGFGIAPKLLSYAENALRALGAKYVGMTSKHPVGGPPIGEFLEKRGYREVAVYYSKNLEED